MFRTYGSRQPGPGLSGLHALCWGGSHCGQPGCVRDPRGTSDHKPPLNGAALDAGTLPAFITSPASTTPHKWSLPTGAATVRSSWRTDTQAVVAKPGSEAAAGATRQMGIGRWGNSVLARPTISGPTLWSSVQQLEVAASSRRDPPRAVRSDVGVRRSVLLHNAITLERLWNRRTLKAMSLEEYLEWAGSGRCMRHGTRHTTDVLH